MARAEPTLAWIVPPAALAAERSRPVIAGGDGGAPDRWGLGFSTLVHVGLVALIATLALAPRLEIETPPLEVAIVSAAAEQSAPASGRAPDGDVTGPPPSPPSQAASASTPPEPAVEPEPETAPPPAAEPEAKPAEIVPEAAKPEPPQPAPTETAAKPEPPQPAPKVEAAKPNKAKPAVSPRPPQLADREAPPVAAPASKTPPVASRGVEGSGSGTPTLEGAAANFKALVTPHPTYPRIAQQLGEEGEVQLLIEIGTDGVPTNIKVMRSSGFGSLDQEAIKTAWRWRFAPIPNPKPVLLPFNFKLKK